MVFRGVVSVCLSVRGFWARWLRVSKEGGDTSWDRMPCQHFPNVFSNNWCVRKAQINPSVRKRVGGRRG